MATQTPRLLFVLKHREGAWGDGYGYVYSSGLLNSVSFVVEMLMGLGITAKYMDVIDNNSIDAAVAGYQPTHVIIEALWVVPEKFDVLKALHPRVQWIVRNHSEIPFMANEGIAMEWIVGYLQRDVEIMCNAPRTLSDVRSIARNQGLPERLVSYGPNYYPVPSISDVTYRAPSTGTLNIGCFGAIRPLKNHLAQAVAAMQYAASVNRPLAFHINATRVEGQGEPTLKNLRALFANAPYAQLVEHSWLSHDAFLALVGTMDLMMQVSFSETFNIVTADAVSQSVPVVVSNEIAWMDAGSQADPTDIQAIVDTIGRVLDGWQTIAPAYKQRRDLLAYCRASEEVWLERFAP